MLFPMMAQLDLPAPRLRDLPSPPLMERFLFESPWALAGLLVVLGVAAFVYLNARRRARQGLLAGGACIALGVGVLLVAGIVTTKREELLRESRVLFDALAKADARTVERLLGPAASAGAAGALRNDLTRQELLDLVRDAQDAGGEYRVAGERIGVQDYRIREVRGALVSDTIGRSQINVVITPTNGTITPTWWEMDWDWIDGAWRLRRLDLVWVAGVRGIGPG